MIHVVRELVCVLLLTEPKPMIPICKSDGVFTRLLRQHGFDQIMVNVSHYEIESYFRESGLQITIPEGELLTAL